MWIEYGDNVVKMGKIQSNFLECTILLCVHVYITVNVFEYVYNVHTCTRVVGHGNAFGYGKFFEYTLPVPDFNIQTVGMSLPDDQGFWDVQRNFSKKQAHI